MEEPSEAMPAAGGGPHRVAIVGAGPRGMYCLEALGRALAQHSEGPRVAINLFDPCEHPGAGNVYALDQPACLRMNFANDRIDAWVEHADRSPDHRSLVDWLRVHAPEQANPHGYAPRSIVGRYLHDCFQQIVEETRRHATVTIHPARVTQLQQVDGAWKISGEQTSIVADDLVLTTGHEGWRGTGSLVQREDERIIGHVFPVQRQLTRGRIAPQSTVAIRGLGLTWIDACLAMTEGRGGTFRGHANHAVYHAGGEEPAKLLAYSRTGRPLLAKSVESKMSLPDSLLEIWQQGRVALARAARSNDPAQQVHAIWQQITETAAKAHEALSTDRTFNARSHLTQWFAWWSETTFTAEQTYASLKQSRDIALGLAPPDEAWVWGETWRRLYPALVERISHGRLCAQGWRLFRKYTIEMERLAFGPPAENVSRILALIDAGIVDLRFVGGAELLRTTDALTLQRGGVRQQVDRVVNAVIPSPTEIDPQGPISHLLERGTIVWNERSIGIPIDRHGCPPPYPRDNLALFGRSSEGPVLGNDTLSRKLHPQIENWAHSTARRIVSREKLP